MEATGQRLLRWWGGLFRAVFIAAVGIVGFGLIDPPSISDRPLAELTLGGYTVLGATLIVWIMVGNH